MAISRLSSDIVGKSDAYKYSHWPQYPPGTRFVESYMEMRIGAKYRKVVPFGLQYYLMEYFEGVRVTRESIDKMQRRIHKQMGSSEIFNIKGWLRLLEKHKGLLPLSINALPEGMVVDTSNALFVIRNTDEEFPWLTNFAETSDMKVWFPTTVASAQYAKRNMFLDFLIKTGTPETIETRWVCFAYRGTSSEESAAIGGAAHLLNFMTSDTEIADEFIEAYYDGDEVQSLTVPASEHSTMTSWGRDREKDAYENMLKKYPTGIVSVVSDSYDYENAVRKIWGEELHDLVISRDGVTVIRPDSGDPSSMVLRSCQWLGEKFGFEENAKGYKVLDKHVRVIQGDGINYNSAYDILATLERQGWSADNVILGEGGASLQAVTRDTMATALKACAIDIDGIWHDVYKDPKTDPGKASKAGHLAVVNVNGTFRTIKKRDGVEYTDDLLIPVFRDGKILKKHKFADIRRRIHEGEALKTTV
jgi:nicotinamide phosphoribosyltransferase